MVSTVGRCCWPEDSLNQTEPGSFPSIRGTLRRTVRRTRQSEWEGSSMAIEGGSRLVARVLLLLALSVFSTALVTSLRPLAAAPSGLQFDHVVIIAMENQNYGSVIGSSSAPFINSLAAQGSTIPNYHSYGANAFSGDNINGCSAACYVALISGSDNGVSDGYSCCLTGTTFVDQLQSAGLTWQAYCESGCPRGNDHFPFTGFASDANSPDIFTASSVTTSQFIAAANSANPPNFLWYTPTDNHNMHDNSVSSGDSYLKKFLVGNGTVLSPGSGSLLSSSLFGNSQYRTLLYLCWDEYDSHIHGSGNLCVNLDSPRLCRRLRNISPNSSSSPRSPPYNELHGQPSNPGRRADSDVYRHSPRREWPL